LTGRTARRIVSGRLSEPETDRDTDVPHRAARPLRRFHAASVTYAPIPFVGDAASPLDLTHLPVWDDEEMLGEDARKALDRGEDWVESATDTSWITPR
jgi:hypothetical protein